MLAQAALAVSRSEIKGVLSTTSAVTNSTFDSSAGPNEVSFEFADDVLAVTNTAGVGSRGSACPTRATTTATRCHHLGQMPSRAGGHPLSAMTRQEHSLFAWRGSADKP